MKNLAALSLLVLLLAPDCLAAPVVKAVVNGASFSSGSMAPGTIISVFGTGLSQSTASASSLPLPITLGGTTVTIASQPIPLFFVSPTQINAQMPFLLPTGTAQLAVRDALGTVSTLTIGIAAGSPGIFTYTSDGKGAGAALHANYKPVRRAILEYALAGETIMLFCTGLGAVQGSASAGFAAPSSLPATTVVTPTVSMDGQAAKVAFAGLAPGFAGLYQINIVVPLNVGGDVLTTIKVGDAVSNEVTINVAGTYFLAPSYVGPLDVVNPPHGYRLEMTGIAFETATLFSGRYRILDQGAPVNAGGFAAERMGPSLFLLVLVDSLDLGIPVWGLMDTLDAGRSFLGCIVDDRDKPTKCLATFDLAMQAPSMPATPPVILPGISGSCALLEGATIYANDGRFLGRITANIFAADSIGNPFGMYGSQFSLWSIFNVYGTYGSQFSNLSAFNQFATQPPIVFINTTPVAFLTVNQFKLPRIDPYAIYPCIGKR